MPKHVKILAWDLDNTLWQGTLVESGPGVVTLKPGVVEVIRELGRRGIVSTVVSKNNEGDALQELRRFGLDEDFVFAKVSWDPKSVSLKELIQQFNVGEDTFAFIDDSPFERANELDRAQCVVEQHRPRVRLVAETRQSRRLDDRLDPVSQQGG